jgi:hypothetical protein
MRRFHPVLALVVKEQPKATVLRFRPCLKSPS